MFMGLVIFHESFWRMYAPACRSVYNYNFFGITSDISLGVRGIIEGDGVQRLVDIAN